MTKVKICGITNIDDARLALEFGADMLGFNFYEFSPRYISPQKALSIINDLPQDTVSVGVFVNMEDYRVEEFIDLLSLDAVQLHGDESSDFISSLRRYTDAKIIRAVRVNTDFQVKTINETGADSVLLDAFSKDKYGGTGERFEWDIAADAVNVVPELILAGGLTPDNVSEAIRMVRPFAVDVASGVESAPGRKDPSKLETFIMNAKQA